MLFFLSLASLSFSFTLSILTNINISYQYFPVTEGGGSPNLYFHPTKTIAITTNLFHIKRRRRKLLCVHCKIVGICVSFWKILDLGIGFVLLIAFYKRENKSLNSQIVGNCVYFTKVSIWVFGLFYWSQKTAFYKKKKDLVCW